MAGNGHPIDPEVFWQLGEQLGRRVRIGWCSRDADGRYDVFFRPQAAQSPAERPQPGDDGSARSKTARQDAATDSTRQDAACEPPKRVDWRRYANDPLAAASSQQAVVELREHLKQRLPHYMIPAAVVVLDDLPLTPQGKLDRRALPPPPAARPDWSAGYVAPRDDEEALVADVYEKLLGVSPVGAKDNFFDLGGHSMLAVRMVAAIQQRSGRRLPLAALFQQATVEYIARLLREPEICPPESSLIPLRREGSRRPLFVVHPAGGTVFCYRNLVEHLGPQRPVYGLQAVGLDGIRPPQDNAHEMAAHYAEAIRSLQPHGPYLLGGWSLGGNLAFETARQLTQQGEPIGLLALFDSGAMPPDREPNEDDFLPIIMDLFPGDDDLTLEDLRQMAPRQHLEYFVQRATKAGVIVPEFGIDVGAHVFEVFKNNLKAMWEYRPGPYPGRITLFASEQQPESVEIARDPMLGWGAWAKDGVEVHRIPGRHLDIIKEPNVRTLAERLHRCILEADAEEHP